jgi:hypothetical protein
MTILYRLAVFMLIILGAICMFVVLLVKLPPLWLMDFVGCIKRFGRTYSTQSARQRIVLDEHKRKEEENSSNNS